MTDKILIIDFGSQVTQLIARRVREAGVYSEIVPFQNAEQAFREMKPNGVILSGGPASTHEIGSPRAPQEIFDAGIPILGICYGQMTLCVQTGGKAESSDHREFGRAYVKVVGKSPLFDGIWEVGSSHQVWMSHGDRVVELAPGFEVIGVSENAPFAAYANEEKRQYGVMFHPEVVHTPDGAKLLSNFVHHICGCVSDWSMAQFRATAIKRIQEQVGDKKVICGLSGGVDSSVTAVLIHEAIGEQLTCIYVDSGLMRQNESEQVVGLFREHYNIPLVHVDASEIFISALEGQTDPERKRKIIGGLFIDVFEDEANRLVEPISLRRGHSIPM